MSRLLFTGGTVVTAEGSFRAEVLVEDERVDASGKLVMPGFIDAHTHMDMPFGGTVTADDWATGTESAAAGGTTMIIDFALQEEGGTLGGAIDEWTNKARDKAVIDYGFHVAITDLRDDIKTELPSVAERGVASVKIFMAYKGTPLYTEDEDLFEALQLSRDAGVLVMVHAENGDAIAKLQQQALSRGDTAPRFHALTRPEPVEAEATNRAIRLAEVAGAPILVVHVSCAPALEAIHLAHERGQTVYAETCPQYFAFSYDDLAREGFEGAKYVCSPPLRDATNQARIYGAYSRKGALVPGADADIVLWDPELQVSATADNRHGNVDYTPYEGMTFHGGPASVYVRGNLVYRDGELVGERGSGRFVERNFKATNVEVKV